MGNPPNDINDKTNPTYKDNNNRDQPKRSLNHSTNAIIYNNIESAEKKSKLFLLMMIIKEVMKKQSST